MKNIFPGAWRTRGWLACLLWPVAQVYAVLVKFRRTLYRRGMLWSRRFEVPVIVVGNVVAGGAGKTPLVMALVRHLQAQGLMVGVVSRGYGRSGGQSLEVRPDTPVDESGDEPALIQRTTGAPVFVADRRIDAVSDLLATYPMISAVVCDDGFQHYALQRDIEIVVFDDRGTGSPDQRISLCNSACRRCNSSRDRRNRTAPVPAYRPGSEPRRRPSRRTVRATAAPPPQPLQASCASASGT